MNTFNVFMIGVGGQGIGLLSEVLIRATDRAGHRVKGVDTHGLAQRGGTVISHLRLGGEVHSPLTSPHEADLGIALERHEALRALNTAVRDGGTLLYYDTCLQPLAVRTGNAGTVRDEDIAAACTERGVRRLAVARPGLDDARMQNVVVLAALTRHELLPGVSREHVEQAMDDLMEGPLLEKNLALFRRELALPAET